jgi:hypothetical protein
MGIEEEEEVQAKEKRNIVNKRITEKFPNIFSHSGSGIFQNTKQT